MIKKIFNFQLSIFKPKLSYVKLNANSGMTLLIAIGVMSILLFISFAVVNITLKSSQFAASGRDSQFAFYAADAGLECALFWDTKSSSTSKFATSTDGSPISCSNNSMSTGATLQGTSSTARIGGGGDSNSTSIFSFVMNTGNSPLTSCAIVTITKNTDGSTYIKSRGYNNCVTNTPRRVERGIEITY